MKLSRLFFGLCVAGALVAPATANASSMLPQACKIGNSYYIGIQTPSGVQQFNSSMCTTAGGTYGAAAGFDFGG